MLLLLMLLRRLWCTNATGDSKCRLVVLVISRCSCRTEGYFDVVLLLLSLVAIILPLMFITTEKGSCLFSFHFSSSLQTCLWVVAGFAYHTLLQS